MQNLLLGYLEIKPICYQCMKPLQKHYSQKIWHYTHRWFKSLCWRNSILRQLIRQLGAWAYNRGSESPLAPSLSSSQEQGEEWCLPYRTVRMKWNNAWEVVPRNLLSTCQCFTSGKSFLSLQSLSSLRKTMNRNPLPPTDVTSHQPSISTLDLLCYFAENTSAFQQYQTVTKAPSARKAMKARWGWAAAPPYLPTAHSFLHSAVFLL